MRFWVAALLASALAAQTAASQDGDAGLAPYVAVYDVRYKSMGVGTSRTELRRAPQPGRWIIETRSDASGLAKLIASGTILQRSIFDFDGGTTRPLSFLLDDGTAATGDDVALEFDWRAGRVRGTAENESVDVPAEPGLQDVGSIQALVQARLRAGAEPGAISMIEKDYVKRYRYTLLRRERLRTAIGELDTVVYRSSREGSKRETIFWYAPQLGYAMVYAEQRRDGRRALQTSIRRFERGG
ncbi:MAG: DUF3108 domain-containing protein [Gammaproteobacteria bacterium]